MALFTKGSLGKILSVCKKWKSSSLQTLNDKNLTKLVDIERKKK